MEPMSSDYLLKTIESKNGSISNLKAYIEELEAKLSEKDSPSINIDNRRLQTKIKTLKEEIKFANERYRSLQKSYKELYSIKIGPIINSQGKYEKDSTIQIVSHLRKQIEQLENEIEMERAIHNQMCYELESQVSNW